MSSIEKLALQAMLSEVNNLEKKLYQLSTDVIDQLLSQSEIKRQVIERAKDLQQVRNWIIALQNK